MKQSKKAVKLKPKSEPRGTIKLKIKTTPKTKSSLGKKQMKSNESNSDGDTNGKRKSNVATKAPRQKKRRNSLSSKFIVNN